MVWGCRESASSQSTLSDASFRRKAGILCLPCTCGHVSTILTSLDRAPIVRSVAHECFADEIAIDFPSAGRVVERMRDSFLGEPSVPDVFDTELLLTPFEAFSGLRMPLVVPIRGAC